MNYKSISLLVLATVVIASCKKEGGENIQRELTVTEKAETQALIDDALNVDPNKKVAIIEFSKLEHDFGTINPDDVVETIFTFTNTGTADLLISNAAGSCGCTVPEYPRELIAPGQKADIKVSFSPKGKSGMQNKTVTLTTNTASGMEKLTIKANIVK
jgi:hypothetical protein